MYPHVWVLSLEEEEELASDSYNNKNSSDNTMSSAYPNMYLAPDMLSFSDQHSSDPYPYRTRHHPYDSYSSSSSSCDSSPYTPSMSLDWSSTSFYPPPTPNYSAVRETYTSLIDAPPYSPPTSWDPPSSSSSSSSLWDNNPFTTQETKPDISQLDFPHHQHLLPSPPSPSLSHSLSPLVSPKPLPVPAKSCSHCHATTTPLWRREPGTMRTLCNACGLYLQQRNKLRPQELIDADLDLPDDGDSERVEGGPECSHCHTHNTSVWRRSKAGAQLCNACGVYLRLRGRERPLALRRNRIKPRSKHVK